MYLILYVWRQSYWNILDLLPITRRSTCFHVSSTSHFSSTLALQIQRENGDNDGRWYRTSVQCKVQHTLFLCSGLWIWLLLYEQWASLMCDAWTLNILLSCGKTYSYDWSGSCLSYWKSIMIIGYKLSNVAAVASWQFYQQKNHSHQI